MSQNDRVLAVLQDGNPKSIQTIHAAVGPCRLNSRIAELRKRGHDIICFRAKVGRDDRGRDVWTYYYRLVKPALDGAESCVGRSVPSSVGADDAASPSLPPGTPTLDSQQLDLFDTRRQPAWA